MNTSFIKFDKAASYIPGVSTVVNLPEIIYKLFTMNELDEKNLQTDSVKSYLSEKSLIRCIVLLIPILGNLAILASDLIELGRNRENNAPTTATLEPVVPPEKIHQLIEQRKKVEAEFQEIVPLATEILKNEGKSLSSELEESKNIISNTTNSANAAIDKCNLVTNFSGKDDDYVGKIIDTIALGAIVYMGSGLTVLGLCGSAITLKAWSFFRGGS